MVDLAMVRSSVLGVWTLRGLIEDVRCFVVPGDEGYLLTVERAGEHLLEELHADFDEMLMRAHELRTTLVRVGFAPVTTDLPGGRPAGLRLDSLLLDFVRLGTAPVSAVGVRPS